MDMGEVKADPWRNFGASVHLWDLRHTYSVGRRAEDVCCASAAPRSALQVSVLSDMRTGEREGGLPGVLPRISHLCLRRGKVEKLITGVSSGLRRRLGWERGEKGDCVTAGTALNTALAFNPSSPLTLTDAAPAFRDVGVGEPLPVGRRGRVEIVKRELWVT